jgi:ABC-2 type transport system permease protein
MNKTVQVLKYEFIKMVKSKGFIIVSLLFPVLALLVLGGYQLVQRMSTEDTTPKVMTIGYVDEAGGFDDAGDVGEITFVRYESAKKATEALLEGTTDEYFIIPLDYVSSGIVKRFTLDRELEPPGSTIRAIRSFLLSNLLQEQISSEMLERAKSPAGFISTRLDETGQVSSEQGGVLGAFLVPYLFGFLFWIAVLMGSFTLLEGLGEEKENRIMEILISSVSTKQLLVGKIIGLGAAGLLQIIFWFVIARFIAGMTSATVGGMFSNLEIPTRLIVFGIAYFILGYLLFGVLFSTIGAIVPTYREGQQLSFFLMPLGIIPLALTPFFVENANHPLTYFLTFFPISAPVTSMIRIGIGNISYWQLSLNIVLLVISIAGLLFLGAKIFRTFLLMYGKRPNLTEIIRSLRQT